MSNRPHRTTPTAVALATALFLIAGWFLVSSSSGLAAKSIPAAEMQGQLLRGTGANGDITADAPGVRHLITPADIPPPYATPATGNGPKIVPRPEGFAAKVPAGFKVDLYAAGLSNPRLIRAAPNGDLFLAESGPGRIKIFRGVSASGQAETTSVFAESLRQPFGINFYPPGKNPQYVYVTAPDSIMRFPYKNGDLTATGPPEVIISDLPGGKNGGGGHWTRDLCFTADGKKMYVTVGSRNNALEDSKPELDARRAVILAFTPDGKEERTVASGIRNAVSIALHPATGELWASIQERDGLGDDTPADYITRIKEGGFYGWPWYYVGPNEQPTLKGAHPELKDKTIVPEVLLQAHSASMQLCFYTGKQFPREYQNDAFAALRGSSNRKVRTGYKVVRAILKNGKPTGEYEDFLTGFVAADDKVYARPVGVTVGGDGALYVTEDGNGTVWRVSYAGHS